MEASGRMLMVDKTFEVELHIVGLMIVWQKVGKCSWEQDNWQKRAFKFTPVKQRENKSLCNEKCLLLCISDVDECADGQCEDVCENSQGGYYCGCPEGYVEYWAQCVGKLPECIS